jgi:vacuolar iron transporter family protein
MPNLIAHKERHGKGAQSGMLRAAVFGVNDGLVSNLSLMMGIAGANTESKFVLLAGVAGLLAGAFSMGAGEYISMRVQREVFEKLIAVEKREQATLPEEERIELQGIYESKGIPPEQSAKLSQTVMSDKKLALETHVREELGLNPDALGSPWGAATSSFFAFVGGAIIPVLPFIFSSGTTAFALSIILSGGGLLAVGASLSFVTGKSWIFSSLRMLGIGGLAAAVTYLVGYLLGVSIGT